MHDQQIFKIPTPEEIVIRREMYGKMEVDAWVKNFKKRPDVQYNKDTDRWDVMSCNDTITLYNMDYITAIPIKFGTVKGNFWCGSNCNLTSLDGCPIHVGGWFWCEHNSKLMSIDHCPRTVGDWFDCSKGNGKKFTMYEIEKWCTFRS